MHQMPAESQQFASVLGFPDPHRVISTAGGKPAAVGAELHVFDPAVMPVDCHERRPPLGVPEPDGLVPASAGDGPAVGGESEAVNPTAVPLDLSDSPGGVDGPELDQVLAAQREPLAVRRERESCDPAHRSLPVENQAAGGSIPHPEAADDVVAALDSKA